MALRQVANAKRVHSSDLIDFSALNPSFLLGKPLPTSKLLPLVAATSAASTALPSTYL